MKQGAFRFFTLGSLIAASLATAGIATMGVIARGTPRNPAAADAPGPRATPPFLDYRDEKPGALHKITLKDLPEPYATKSAGNAAELIKRPANAWPKAPDGFKVELYAEGLDNPRLIRTASNGDFFLAESRSGKIKVLRGISSSGKADQVSVFASGLEEPYGIAFYPPNARTQFVYIGSENSVVRYPYLGRQRGRVERRNLCELDLLQQELGQLPPVRVKVSILGDHR